jgi:type IV secretory pathway VirB2 component (pilin)
MRSDMKALLKVFAGSFAVALLVVGVAVAAAVGWLTKEVAGYLMLACIVVGVVVIGRLFRSSLFRQQPCEDRPAESDAAPDRGGDWPSPGS